MNSAASPPPPPPPTAAGIHVGDLDGGPSNLGGSWQASVTISVHDETHAPVSGVSVSGSWSGGSSGAASCITAGNGDCSLSSPTMRKRIGNTSFTINNLSDAASASYQANANHDPDQESDGSIITVYK